MPVRLGHLLDKTYRWTRAYSGPDDWVDVERCSHMSDRDGINGGQAPPRTRSGGTWIALLGTAAAVALMAGVWNQPAVEVFGWAIAPNWLILVAYLFGVFAGTMQARAKAAAGR